MKNNNALRSIRTLAASCAVGLVVLTLGTVAVLGISRLSVDYGSIALAVVLTGVSLVVLGLMGLLLRALRRPS